MSDQFEIEIWVTHDKGRIWTQNHVTSQSSHLNVRPIIPRQYSPDNEGTWFYIFTASPKKEYISLIGDLGVWGVEGSPLELRGRMRTNMRKPPPPNTPLRRPGLPPRAERPKRA